MGTYDHKQILSDYVNGKMTAETALGHTLQHVDKLYELQTTANVNRYELRSRIDTLENRVNALQVEVARLTTRVETLSVEPKRKAGDKAPSDNP